MDKDQRKRAEFAVKRYLERAQKHQEEAKKNQEAADANFLAAGKQLVKLRDDYKANKANYPIWEKYVETFGLNRSRADELIRIAEERTTAQQVRKGTRDRMRRHRAQKKPPSHNGGDGGFSQDDTTKEGEARRGPGGQVISLEHLRKVGAEHHLTPQQQEIFEQTSSLAAAQGCDFNPERDKEGEWMTLAQQWAGAFQWQTGEARRLANESALFRRGAAPPTAADVATIDLVIADWNALRARAVQQLEKAS